MRQTVFCLAIILIAVTGIAFLGCSNSPSANTTDTSTSTSEAHDDHDGHNHDGHGHDSTSNGGDAMAKMGKGLAKLSEADRASAMKQHVCPVTDEMLGTMGEPIKVAVEDQEVWICCDGCKKDLLASPDEYLAKLIK